MMRFLILISAVATVSACLPKPPEPPEPPKPIVPGPAPEDVLNAPVDVEPAGVVIPS